MTLAAERLSRNEIMVGGEWVKPAGAGRIEVENPATEEVFATVPEAGVPEADRAMAAARRAFDTGPWPQMTYAERAEVLGKAAAGIEQRGAEFGSIFVQDQGGPASFAPFMSMITALVVRDHVGLASSFSDEPEDRDTPLGRALIYREPVGPVVAVVPWNAPAILAAVKLAPALLAGCPVVLKVSPETPLASFVLAEVFAEAGVPEGVLSFLPGGRELGQYLVAHPDAAHVSFTGSTASGQNVMRAAADNLTRLTLELGGKSAAIVLDDMQPAELGPMLMGGCMVGTGQVCTTQSRILVPAARRAEWVEAIAAAFAAFPVGDPTDPGTAIGPLVNAAQRSRAESYIASARADGATVVVGGNRPAHLPRGYYVEPTLISDVTPDMQIVREEVFGPVICIQPYNDIDDAVRIANDTPFGLANGIYTKDQDLAIAIGKRLQSGTVSVNAFGSILTQPFGGWKKSGIGREGGREGVEAFLEYKQIQLTSFPRG